MRSLCFVDDQKDEIDRFEKHLGTRFSVGADTNIDDALKKLSGRKPDLFVLDMYIGRHVPNAEEVAEMQKARKEFLTAETRFYELLERYGQSWEKGFENLDDARKRYGRNQAVVFFTRKARFEDAVRAQKRGVTIIKKPDASPAALTVSPQDVDNALADKAGELAQEFANAIRASSWWVRHRDQVTGFVGGLITGFFAAVLAGLFLHFAVHVAL